MMTLLTLSALLAIPHAEGSAPPQAPAPAAGTAAGAASAPAGTAPTGASDSTLTIYSSADPASFDPRQFVEQERAGINAAFASQIPGFGVVRETRAVTMNLPAGAGDGTVIVPFTDVAQFIDPTTVSFKDLTDPATVVRGQNFQFDLVNPEKLMQKYLGREITVSVDEGMKPRSFTGTLLSNNGGQIVVQTSEGVRILPASGARIELGDLPGGLLTKPTLLWDLAVKKGGQHQVQLAYQTAGLTWRADYNLVLGADGSAAATGAAGNSEQAAAQESSAGAVKGTADLSAWVTILNMCGTGWNNAGLKLVAGSVHKIEPMRPYLPRSSGRPMGGANAAGEKLGFEEKSFFEYHLYTLPRKTDVPASSSQQLVLFPTATSVPIERVLIVDGTPDFGHWGAPMSDQAWGAGQKLKAQVFIRVTNSKENKLGMPLPAGKVRVYQADTDGALEFLGEDVIQHTPRDEKVMVKVGDAFDVVGERTQVSFAVDTNRKEITESIKLQLRNRKEAPVRVVMREHLYRWSGWEITQKSMEFVKVNSSTIEFPIDVPAGGDKEITYTVVYRW